MKQLNQQESLRGQWIVAKDVSRLHHLRSIWHGLITQMSYRLVHVNKAEMTRYANGWSSRQWTAEM